MAISLVAWDFDGVLNANIQDGRFIWADTFEQDIGVPVERFVQACFLSGDFDEVLVGVRDLEDVVAAWIEEECLAISPRAFMDYWFGKDVHPDMEVLDLAARLSVRQVIATNNEAHRAGYIWGEMGFSERMDRIFAAGPMGFKKPDQRFFEEICTWADCAPAEALLIDDNVPNVEAARKFGWNAFHFSHDTRGGLEAELLRLGLL
ncbi:HAD family hydrolase [Algicella marina]|uniref:HAD-IA family hydrolase n=1 Tax=Algicella marina TaxID=2683284 RepID=A0A6P1SZ20_9RHOB|nr:HAD-IA family hydrolase [Algicella marina]QHQ35718.1 HAD-IA family hydrolase [Algicella marina]